MLFTPEEKDNFRVRTKLARHKKAATIFQVRMVAVTSEACGYALMRQLVKLTLLGPMHTVLCSKLVS